MRSILNIPPGSLFQFFRLQCVWTFWLRRSASCCCLRNQPISRSKTHRRVSWPHLGSGTNFILGGHATAGFRLFFDGHSMTILPCSKTVVTLISFKFLGYPCCLPIGSSFAGFRSQSHAGQLHQRKQEVLKTAESQDIQRYSKIFQISICRYFCVLYPVA